ncbi:MAG TPA: PorV/PorQ family protein [Spirochaetota bacterium]|nr:PorV/PorQ family protein [Spirochaetota bacterium]
MKKIIIFITLFISSLIAEDKAYGAVFSEIRGSARVRGMGGAGAGLEKNVNSLLYNPAGLAALNNLALSASYQNTLFQNHYSELLLANDFGFGRIGIAFSMLAVPMGNIYNLGTAGSKETLSAILLGLTYQRDFGPFSMGITAKFLQEDLGAETSPTVGFDTGFLLRLRPEAKVHKLNIGLAARNLGLGMKFKEQRETLNMSFRAGVYYLPFSKLAVAVDSVYQLNGLFSVNSGVEVMPHWMFTPRAGYEITFNDPENSSALSFGLSFNKELGSTVLGIDWASSLDFDKNIGFDNHCFNLRIERPAIWTVKKQIKKIDWDGQHALALAVMDFKGENVPASLAASAAGFLRNDLSASRALTVVRRDKMKQVFNEQALQMSGITSGDDAVAAGKVLNVRYFVYGTIAKVGSEYYISIAVVDVESGAEASSVEETAGSRAGIRNTIKKIAFLLDPANEGERAAADEADYVKPAETAAVSTDTPADSLDSIDALDDLDAAEPEKYPAVFTSSDPRYAEFTKNIKLIKKHYKNQQFYQAAKYMIRVFNLSPNNARCRGYLSKIYTRLTPPQQQKIKTFMQKIIQKYKTSDPEKSSGYQELLEIVKGL